MLLLCDSREPADPHPWKRFLPEVWQLERTALEVGDFCLATHPHGALVERKTPRDMAGCIGAGRERFDRELRISSYAGRFVVLVEGSLSDVALARHGIHANSVLGTLASWTLRFCPIVFAGSERLAAAFSWRFLASQLPNALPQEDNCARQADLIDAPPF
jgi:ERCC4-type nuclease